MFSFIIFIASITERILRHGPKIVFIFVTLKEKIRLLF
jgi:hypothetical protein